MTFAASVMLALAMLIAPDMVAQTRSSGGSRSSQQTTRSSSGSSSSRSSSSSSSTRSSGSSSSSRSSVSSSSSRSSSASSSRSSGSSSVQQDNRRSSSGSSASRSSSTSSSSRSSGSSSVQQDNRRSSSGSSASRSSSTGSSRSSGSSSVQQDNRRSSSGSTTRSSGTARSSESGTVRSSSGTARSSSGTAPVASSSDQQQDKRSGNTARASNVTSHGLTGTPNESAHNNQEAYRDPGYNYRYNDGMRVDDRHNMYRVPPRQREPMHWDRPGYFWGDHPHYYGYRVHSLPPHWRRISHWGIDYYYYNGIYYRPFGGVYVVCRPPFGTPLEAAIDRAILRSIRFAYYYDTYRTYETVFDNYNIIARQNLIIAQQNARIIANNANYAINSNRALTAYELANKLGLVQSYAYANSEYFYQDGVFYTISASGVYSTIIPPAGALVTSLPDDYEVIVMGGIEYYLVDNTVYRTTVFEGEPYLEVLGQMYGSLYNQYNVYR